MNPTGSGLERGIACPPSVALVQAGRTTEASEGGTSNHEKIEVALDKGGEVPEVVTEMLKGATKREVEIAFALDVATRTVRLLGRSLQRNYGPLSPTEIALTIDIVIWRPDELLVVDWKSRKRVTPASKNWQVKAQALAVLVYYGADELVAGIGYLDNGETDLAPFDCFDVPRLWDDLERAVKAWRQAEQDMQAGKALRVHSGSWCEYCPAFSYCPEQTRLALAMVDELSDVERQIESMTAEQAGAAWVKLRQVQALAERVEESLRVRAHHEPLVLGEDRVLMAVEMPGRMSLDQGAVKERYAALGEPLPMKRGKDFVQLKEVVRKRKEKAA